eukprot:830596-Pelagomonas_calceolata.AAC.5
MPSKLSKVHGVKRQPSREYHTHSAWHVHPGALGKGFEKQICIQVSHGKGVHIDNTHIYTHMCACCAAGAMTAPQIGTNTQKETHVHTPACVLAAQQALCPLPPSRARWRGSQLAAASAAPGAAGLRTWRPACSTYAHEFTASGELEQACTW